MLIGAYNPMLCSIHAFFFFCLKAGRAAVEARGIILRYPSWEVACYPFDKFFNLGEGVLDLGLISTISHVLLSFVPPYSRRVRCAS